MSGCPYRPDLPERPARVMALPVAEGGYPAPWFSAVVNGKHDLRLIGPGKAREAVRRGVCWICGEPLGAIKTFVAGPVSAINRASIEPPSHTECAEYAAKTCPYLTRPASHRNEKDLPAYHEAGIMIKGNPGVSALYSCKGYTVQEYRGDLVIRMNDPVSVKWWSRGRLATRDEVLDALKKAHEKLVAMTWNDTDQAEIFQDYEAACKTAPRE